MAVMLNIGAVVAAIGLFMATLSLGPRSERA